MKNLLVITLFFSSFGYGYILDCYISEKETDIGNFSREVKIEIFSQLEPIKKNTYIEYNLVPLRVTKATADSIYAERRYKSDLGGFLVHKLQISRTSPTFISNFYRDDNGKLTKTTQDSGLCKLR